MSNFPPAVPPPAVNYGRPQQPRPANALAIVSLICGIIGCLVITPFIAIITGLLAFGKVRTQGGRGMAITGILLGVLWIGGGLVVAGGGYALFSNLSKIIASSAKPQTIMLINRVAGGDLSHDATTGSLTDADLAAIAAKAKPLGSCQDISVSSSSWNVNNNVFTVEFSGTATFEHGSTGITAKMHGAGGKPQTGAATPLAFDELELK